MHEHWITDEEFDQCDNVLYRAYIFNFQEDMWKYVYTCLSFGDDDTPVVKKFYRLLKRNRNRFLAYVADPGPVKINNHLTLITTDLTEMRDNLKSREHRPLFKAHYFLESVERLLEEFGT